MSRRGGVVGLAASILIACVCAGLVAWRLTPPRPHAPTAPAPVAPSPVAAPEAPVRLSTIIDLPGDPVLVRRGAVLAPKDALISVPARLGQQAPQTPAKAFFVNSTLVSSTGGYMGKFQEAGQEAEALAAQLAMNSAQIAAAQKRGGGRGRAGPGRRVPNQADRNLRKRRVRHHHRGQGRRRVRAGGRADRARAIARRFAQEPEHRDALLDRRRRL